MLRVQALHAVIRLSGLPRRSPPLFWAGNRRRTATARLSPPTGRTVTPPAAITGASSPTWCSTSTGAGRPRAPRAAPRSATAIATTQHPGARRRARLGRRGIDLDRLGGRIHVIQVNQRGARNVASYSVGPLPTPPASNSAGTSERWRRRMDNRSLERDALSYPQSKGGDGGTVCS